MRAHRWTPTVSGEQVITLTFTVNFEATGNCYYDAGQSSGPVEQCYEPEAECEITDIAYTITDDAGEVIPNEGELGKVILAQFDGPDVERQMMETSPEDYREEREYEPS